MNPENDLKYGAQNFGKSRNGYYVVIHAINSIIKFKENVSNYFIYLKQIPLHWQANNVHFLPIQDFLRKASLPTVSPKMVSVVPTGSCKSSHRKLRDCKNQIYKMLEVEYSLLILVRVEFHFVINLISLCLLFSE